MINEKLISCADREWAGRKNRDIAWAGRRHRDREWADVYLELHFLHNRNLRH